MSDIEQMLKKKGSDGELRMVVRLLKAMCSEEDGNMINDLIESMKEQRDNYNYNVDTILRLLREENVQKED